MGSLSLCVPLGCLRLLASKGLMLLVLSSSAFPVLACSHFISSVPPQIVKDKPYPSNHTTCTLYLCLHTVGNRRTSFHHFDLNLLSADTSVICLLFWCPPAHSCKY